MERLLDHGYDAVEELPGPDHRGQGDQRAPGALLQGQAQGREGADPGVGPRRSRPGAAEDVGLAGSFTQVVKVFSPPRPGHPGDLDRPPEELAARLWRRLKALKGAETAPVQPSD